MRGYQYWVRGRDLVKTSVCRNVRGIRSAVRIRTRIFVGDPEVALSQPMVPACWPRDASGWVRLVARHLGRLSLFSLTGEG